MYCVIEGCRRFYVNRVTKLCATHERQAKKEQKAIDRETNQRNVQAGVHGNHPTIPKFTKKRSEQVKEYNKRVRVWLVGKFCAVFPHLKATECHHKKGRNGALLLDEQYWLPVSSLGHKKIHDNPAWALEMGFVIKRSA